MDGLRRKIGIALSGGGIRAMIFHLGILKWMAENDMLEDIIHISSVSGASLCIGLIYSHNGYRWPTGSEYINEVLPAIQKVVLEKDIQHIVLKKLIFSPWWWNKRVNLLAKVIQKHWNIKGSIADLEVNPKWDINCTTFETGKRFYFSQKRMGDYITMYIENPKISLADAIASSAGFPVLIGPYKMKNEGQFPGVKDKFIHLWDGGVYDNLGLEAIYKVDTGLPTRGINFVVVSNACESIKYQKREKGFSGKNIKRLLDITMDQVGALRSRSVVHKMKLTKNGIYFHIGKSAEDITDKIGVASHLRDELNSKCMSGDDVKKVCSYPISLRKPSESDFHLILRHGYEVAECTYKCYLEGNEELWANQGKIEITS